MSDAEIAEQNEEADDLIALVVGNDSLRWRSEDGADPSKRVLLVTWTDWPGYEASVGQPLDMALQQWVTAVPEVRAFCQQSGLSGQALELRMKQYLGLPPDVPKTHFVELWVDPADVVRPCPDPEVTDTRCSATAEPADVTVGSHVHQAWFEELQSASYGEEGYPWTRLGYTYDWGPDSTERGASEFLIPRGTKVVVESFVATDDYCRDTSSNRKE